jgi:hypothetical protein
VHARIVQDDVEDALGRRFDLQAVDGVDAGHTLAPALEAHGHRLDAAQRRGAQRAHWTADLDVRETGERVAEAQDITTFSFSRIGCTTISVSQLAES